MPFSAKAIAADAKYTKALYNLAIAYEDKGDDDKAIELSPNNAMAHKYYSQFYSNSLDNRNEKSRELMIRAAQLDPRSGIILLNIGNGYGAAMAALRILVERLEGNLLAAQQEIQKLLLVDDDPQVTVDRITEAVANSARFDAFRLVDCALAGRLDESLRVAAGLQRTGVAIQPVYAALYRELMVTETVRAATAAGEDPAAAFRRLRVWPARQAAVRQALQRLSAGDLGEAIRGLSLIDRQSKGRAAGDAWQTLDRLLWFICDPRKADWP